jgi:hypothetical protein
MSAVLPFNMVLLSKNEGLFQYDGAIIKHLFQRELHHG